MSVNTIYNYASRTLIIHGNFEASVLDHFLQLSASSDKETDILIQRPSTRIAWR
jgi:hypothetical protein